MTNHPRYSSPQQPGQGAGGGAPGYPGDPDPYQQQAYDWRYARQQPQHHQQPQAQQPPQQQAYRSPYDPYRVAPAAPQAVASSRMRRM